MDPQPLRRGVGIPKLGYTQVFGFPTGATQRCLESQPGLHTVAWSPNRGYTQVLYKPGLTRVKERLQVVKNNIVFYVYPYPSRNCFKFGRGRPPRFAGGRRVLPVTVFLKHLFFGPFLASGVVRMGPDMRFGSFGFYFIHPVTSIQYSPCSHPVAYVGPGLRR